MGTHRRTLLAGLLLGVVVLAVVVPPVAARPSRRFYLETGAGRDAFRGGYWNVVSLRRTGLFGGGGTARVSYPAALRARGLYADLDAPALFARDTNLLVNLGRHRATASSRQRDLRVELDLAPDLGTIRADDDQLRQLLMNLARKAQTATAGCESPCLRLATRAAGESVVLEVEDNGPGIPADERERVFEPCRSGSAGGLGLGLALVKGIVLAHGGSVRVEEGHWGGARLRVELPCDSEASRE
jgi:light-regulated signal transduction histidine kinase (bacteriophytochrome)